MTFRGKEVGFAIIASPDMRGVAALPESSTHMAKEYHQMSRQQFDPALSKILYENDAKLANSYSLAATITDQLCGLSRNTYRLEEAGKDGFHCGSIKGI